MKQSRRFCPNCGSDWVEPDTSNRAEQFFSGGDPNRWQCNECGYTGMMPEGKPEEAEEDGATFEENKNVPQEYTGFGTAYLKYIVYAAAPVMLLYYLYLRIG
ncbi:MAG: hypothetical protein ABEJ98_04905 [Candidatus Nanohaloarchaea archaeon]